LNNKNIIFHLDNARPHTCNVSNAKPDELGYKILPHPPYSIELAPSDYHLFSNLKKEKRAWWEMIYL
jgi:histone-lysine N-methyltransferase SETMAR